MSVVSGGGGGGGAGALTQLFDSTLGAAAASIDTGAGSIGQASNHLLIVIYARMTGAVTTGNLQITLNNDSTAANYDQQNGSFSGAAANATFSASLGFFGPTIPGSSALASVFGACTIFIPSYRQTTGFKSVHISEGHGDVTNSLGTAWRGATWKNTAAVTRVTATSSSTNLAQGSRMTIYGLN